MTPEEQDAEASKPAEDSSAGGAATPRRRTTRRKTTAASGDAQPSEARPTRRRTKAAGAEAQPADSAPTPRRRRTARATAEAEPAAAQPETPAVQSRPAPRLREKLRTEIGPVLMQEFGYTSPMQIPRLAKIVLNIGLGEALQNPRALESASRDLGLISGQRCVSTKAKKSIAGFKIREGMTIGVTVTLRGRRMYEFLDRFLSSTLPRIRDFQGVSRNAFDGRGNYSLGIREQVIFPEIDYNSIDRLRGLQVVIETTARTDREGLRLLEELGMPFTRIREATSAA